jgi:hypothetical protein
MSATPAAEAAPAQPAAAPPPRIVPSPTAPQRPERAAAPPPPQPVPEIVERETRSREPPIRLLVDRETPALEILRDLPQHGAGTRRFVARGEQLRRKALAQPDAAPHAVDPRSLEERLDHQLAQTLSGIGDDDFGRTAGRWVRRVLWITALLAIAAAAFLRFQIQIGS